ncbi:MAG: YHS domain-containing (seleno)protein [Jhaorihella sp.]
MFLRPLAAFVFVLSALAAPVRADSPVWYSGDGVAINGYDTVAYFTAGKPVPGRTGIEVEWKGALWRFASRRNRERFEANPRAFAPQYGGYCAYAVSRGHVASTDPRAWKIVDGKLYLTHSPSVFRAWLRDIAGNLALSDANWPGVLFK